MIVENATTAFPDRTVWVRTHPVTYLADWVDVSTSHRWHQLTYAARGHLEVETERLKALIPPECALWIPANTAHTETMRAPVSVRTLYIAPGAMPDASTHCRTLAVPPLLRELIHHVTSFGALDVSTEKHAHLSAVLLDQIEAAEDVPLFLPTPRDPRAQDLVRRIEADPSQSTAIAELSREVGASLRTLERCFRSDTGMSIGEWRRRFRMFRARRLLEGGAPVTRVAFDVGYRSVSAFTVAFSRQFGLSPSATAKSERR